MDIDFTESLDNMRCNQIVLILRKDITLTEASKLIEEFTKNEQIQAAIPNAFEGLNDARD